MEVDTFVLDPASALCYDSIMPVLTLHLQQTGIDPSEFFYFLDTFRSVIRTEHRIESAEEQYR